MTRSNHVRYQGRHRAARAARGTRAARPARRRAVVPALVAGVVATTVTVAPQAAHALEAPRATATALPPSVPPYEVLPGMRLRAKPKPWVLPVVGYHLTGRFGQTSGLWASTHTGLDFAAPEGTDIRSIGPGVVQSTAYDGAFGNKTVVRLDDGTVLWYCHQSSFVAQPGQRVAIGDLIGHIGSTGNTTGPHLHLEVHPGGGDAIDPEAWLPTHGLHP